MWRSAGRTRPKREVGAGGAGAGIGGWEARGRPPLALAHQGGDKTTSERPRPLLLRGLRTSSGLANAENLHSCHLRVAVENRIDVLDDVRRHI